MQSSKWANGTVHSWIGPPPKTPFRLPCTPSGASPANQLAAWNQLNQSVVGSSDVCLPRHHTPLPACKRQFPPLWERCFFRLFTVHRPRACFYRPVSFQQPLDLQGHRYLHMLSPNPGTWLISHSEVAEFLRDLETGELIKPTTLYSSMRQTVLAL